jgi:hypothetical protein
MSNYPLHHYGITGTFSTMSTKEAIKFYTLFVLDLENRNGILQNAVHTELGTDIERCNNSVVGATLDMWLCHNYTGLSSDGYVGQLHEKQLVTFGAMCLDAVLFCAERIRRTHQGLEWVKYSGPRSHDAYQKPVIIKRGSKAVLDPFRLSSTVVSKHMTRNNQTTAVATVLNGWDAIFADSHNL